MKYEFLIAANDEVDLASGHKRKKEGDVIAVRPHPWSWGRKEIDNYLIVIAESDLSIRDLRVLCEERLIRRKSDGKIFRYTDVMKEIFNTFSGEDITLTYEEYSKRSCKMDLADIKNEMPDLDLDKVRNRTLKYQPFKSAKQLVEKFSDIKEADVDTVSSSAGKDEEFSIDLTKKSIFFNKQHDVKEVLKKGSTHGLQ